MFPRAADEEDDNDDVHQHVRARNHLLGHLADHDEEDEGTAATTAVYKPPMFALRMGVMLLLAWSTCTLAVGAFILIPLLVGRGVLYISPHFISSYLFRTNDLYTHLIGSYLMGAVMIGATYLFQQVQQRQVMNVLYTVWNYVTLCVKCLVLGALWFTVIPVLLGLAFEISLMIPVLMNDKTALMPLSELWAFGVFLSGICVRFTYLLKNVRALDSWRIEFDRVAANGPQQLEAMRIFLNILFPIIFWLSVFICVPYLFAKLIVPFFVSTRLVQYKVQVYSYPTIVLLFMGYFMVQLVRMGWNKLHESVRDRRYLIRRSVVNLDNPGPVDNLLNTPLQNEQEQRHMQHNDVVMEEDEHHHLHELHEGARPERLVM